MTTRTPWFLDTEFNDDGRTIDLISIALVSLEGTERYWVSSEFDESRCNEFVKQHVLPQLPPPEERTSRAMIAECIKSLVLADGERPEFWAYFADYDWVALCQLYGPMVALPHGFPFWCHDLKQLMEHHGMKKEQLPPQLTAEHNALADARWARDSYLWIHGDERVKSPHPAE